MPAAVAVVLALSMLAAVPLFRAKGAANGGGSTSVSPPEVTQNSGAFTTSVPIEVPPYHGIEPKLSLVYNSSNGNGEYGVGWQLAGLSAIERTGPTGGAPTWTNNDVYSLDGEPLVPSTALGGAYVTKRQSYRRITQNNSNVWTVVAPNGVKSVYAKPETFNDSSSNSIRTRRWLLTSVANPYGRAVSYEYTCSEVNFCRPLHISYSGTTITLYQENRPDYVTAALGGALSRKASRISIIDVKVGAARARLYKLNYTISADTSQSLLTSVRKYGTDAVIGLNNTVTGTAAPATTFTYWANPNLLIPPKKVLPGWCLKGTIYLADVNGDNLPDALCHNFTSGDTRVATGDGTGGFGSTVVWGTGFCNGHNRYLTTGDVNGDNRDDLACYGNHAPIRIALATDRRTFVPTGVNVNVNGSSSWCLGWAAFTDMNTDGKADLVCDRNRVAISVGDGKSFNAYDTEPAAWACYSAIQMADVNGDGYIDFVCYFRYPTARVGVMLGSRGGRFTAEISTPFCAYPIDQNDYHSGAFSVADVNGDGKSDIICSGRFGAKTTLEPDGTPVSTWPDAGTYVALSQGNGHFAPDSKWSQDRYGGTAVDFNGDGRDDLSSGLMSTGTSFKSVSAPFETTCDGTYQESALVDLNDDGRIDKVCFTATATGRSARVELGGKSLAMLHPDLLRDVVSETGGVTSIGYTIPHTRAHFGKRTPNGYHPAAVSRLTMSTGAIVDYTYGDATWDPLERRFLGYETVTARDTASGARTTTTFRVVPNYPTNRIAEVHRYDPDGGTQQRTTHAWNENKVAGAYVATVRTTTDVQSDHTGAMRQTLDHMFTYDGYGNVRFKIDVRDNAEPGNDRLTDTTYTYDTAKYIVDTPSTVTVWAVTSPASVKLSQVSYGYDGFGQVNATTTVSDVATGAVVRTSAHYDKNGNRDWFVDELAHKTTYTYDPVHGQYPLTTCQVSVTPAQCQTQGWNDVLAVRTSLKDANNQTTSWQYDRLGRQTKQLNPGGSATTTTYVNWGNKSTQYIQTATTDGTADGLWSRSYVNGPGLVYKTVSEPDVTALTEYNSQGLPSRVSNPYRTGQKPVYTTYQYDGFGRQTQETFPDSSTRTTTYLVEQANGDKDFAASKLTVKTCDQVGTCRRTAYDSFGNPVLTSEWNGTLEYRTRAVYDELGRLTSMTDALGNVMSQTWDAAGRKRTMKDPDSGTWSYTYDAASHLATQTDPRKVTIVNGYDALGRLTTQKVGNSVLSTRRYDQAGHGAGIGRMTSVTDTSGSTNWTYDALGRITATVKVIGTASFTVRQGYDAAGRRASLTYPDGEVVGYTYDAMGCLKTVGGYVKAATCSPAMDVATRTLGNGAKQVYGYDPNRMWLTSATTTTAAGAVLLTDGYHHRANGQIDSKTSTDTADRWSYAYDKLNRLTTATNSTTAGYTSSYGYDAVGRKLSGTGMGAMAYPPINTSHVHAPSTVNGVKQTYDAAGNLTSDGATTYKYDALNRMYSSTKGAATTTYLYDGAGQRVKAGTMAMIALDGQLLYQTNGPNRAKFYYYGDERIAKKDNPGAVSYYIGTANGSPHLVLNAAAGVIRKSVYGPYGNVLNQTGTVVDPFGLAGEYKDATGLYHLGARYLSPKTGTFTSPDPSGTVDIAEPQTLNRYAYANNDPINLTDPSGLAPIPRQSSGNVNDLLSSSLNVSTGQVSTSLNIEFASATYSWPTATLPAGFSVSGTMPAGPGRMGRYGLGVGTSFDDQGLLGLSRSTLVGASIPLVASGFLTESRYVGLNNDRTAYIYTQTISASYTLFGRAGESINLWSRTIAEYSIASNSAFGSPFENPDAAALLDDPMAQLSLPMPDDYAITPANNWWYDSPSWDLFNDDTWFTDPFDAGWDDSIWNDSAFDSSWNSSPLTGGSFYDFWS